MAWIYNPGARDGLKAGTGQGTRPDSGKTDKHHKSRSSGLSTSRSSKIPWAYSQRLRLICRAKKFKILQGLKASSQRPARHAREGLQAGQVLLKARNQAAASGKAQAPCPLSVRGGEDNMPG